MINARIPSSSMMKSLSLQRRTGRGLENFEKSCINLWMKATCPRKLLKSHMVAGRGRFWMTSILAFDGTISYGR